MYNTGNEVPSSALEDMADNAQVFDALVTKTSGTVTDRLGRTRRVFQQIVTDMGFNPVSGSFQAGATITEYNQCLIDETTGTFYSWGGALPKVVPAGSTPATSGGIGIGAWSDKTDLTLRGEFNKSTHGFRCVAQMLASELSSFLAVNYSGEVVSTNYYNTAIRSLWRVTGEQPADGFYLEGTDGNAGSVWFTLVSRDGDVRHYGATGIGDVIEDGVLSAAAEDVGFFTIPHNTTLRCSTIPIALTSITGGGRLVWDNDAASIVEYEMQDGFYIKDITIETIYRNRLAIKAGNLRVDGVTEVQSDSRTESARYNCVEWRSDGDITISNHVTNNTGVRVLSNGGTVTLCGIKAYVNHVGEGPGIDHGTDGMKVSGAKGLTISCYKCFGTSRDVIDGYIGSGACNISDIWADGFYFNQIELKSAGTSASDNQITPHDINISNIYVGPGGQGRATIMAALLLVNQNVGSLLNSPRRVNISNWNSRLIGLTASGTYHGIFAKGAYDININNVNLLSAKNHGIFASNCTSIKIANSNLHGLDRGASFNAVNDLKIENSNLGSDLEADITSGIGIVFSDVNNNIKISNSNIIGTSRSLSGEATVNSLKAVNCTFTGMILADIFDSLEYTACTLDGNSSPGAFDVFLSDTNTPSTNLKIIGGKLKNGRFGINQQSISNLTCIGVDFENLTVPCGGTVTDHNRRIVNCFSSSAGAFPTASENDVISGNIVI